MFDSDAHAAGSFPDADVDGPCLLCLDFGFECALAFVPLLLFGFRRRV